MPLLTTLFRTAGVNIHGRTVRRTAVRAVVRRQYEMLMVYSSAVGDYKFPGGGVKRGESREQALRRELREECGMQLGEIRAELGSVVEYDVPVEAGYDAFKMTSYYYEVGAIHALPLRETPLDLDDYERALGFEPVWVEIERALEANRALLGSPAEPQWLRREVFVLEYLRLAHG